MPYRGDVHRFRKEIVAASGDDVAKCIQCGKCTAGCPVSPEMDLQPNQVIRLIQVDDGEAVLRSRTIWVCASCRTCSVRCPVEIDIARVMDAARKMALAAGHAGEPNVVRFHRIFLDSVRRRGRVHELGLMLRYNVASRDPFKDAALGPAMLSRGKLDIFGHRIKGTAGLREIFNRSKRTLKK